ncbi:MAG: GNAT family N-acetyltransferase [Proteobacteria bacterium]|nr:GNAT family N-acetyltransferase [Pseudomonadota bacterium]MBW3616810.1 GNAT family N-acetyltransferase [Pseudomonadota bacterium]
MLDGEGALAFAAEAGFILLRSVGPEAEILTLAVAPELRRQGLGRALLDAGLSAARQHGAEAVFLEVAADNAPAAALYAASGFTAVGVRRGYYLRAGGSAVDAVTLRLRLPSPAA